MQHAKPVCIGLNYALGADQMLPFMQVTLTPTPQPQPQPQPQPRPQP